MTNLERAAEISNLIAGSNDRQELIDLTYDSIVQNPLIDTMVFKQQLEFIGIQVDYNAGQNFFAQSGVCKRKS